jgi:replication factor C subunit 3/5
MAMSSSASAAPAKQVMSSKESLPWIEKYRPNSLDDLIAHTEIIKTINRLIDANSLPHRLFYGPPGTGKTSTILACAHRLYGKNFSSMVLELNASDDRGIGVVRNQIKNFAGTRKLFSAGVKLIILDEADALTNVAQAALRRVIEKYSKSTRFCLICNYANKIIPAIQSRCTRFRFAPLKKKEMKGRLREIADAESVNLPESGLEAILDLCQGDMRKMLNILQSAHMAYDNVDRANVYACTGTPQPEDVDRVMDLLLNQGFSQGFRGIRAIRQTKGFALQDILTDVFKRVQGLEFPPAIRSYIVAKLADVEHNLCHATDEIVQLGALVGAFHVVREMMGDQNAMETD